MATRMKPLQQLSVILNVIMLMRSRGRRCIGKDDNFERSKSGTVSVPDTEVQQQSHRVTISADPVYIRTDESKNNEQAREVERENNGIKEQLQEELARGKSRETTLEAEVQRLHNLLSQRSEPVRELSVAKEDRATAAELESLRSKLIQSRSKEISLYEAHEQKASDVKTLEKENSRLKSKLANLHTGHEREITRMLHDLQVVQGEVTGKGDAERSARRLAGENAKLCGEIEREKEESQLLFAEVERLKHIETKALRLENELTTRPVLRVSSPTRVVSVEHEMSKYSHVPKPTLQQSFTESARTPSPLLSPLAESRVKNLAASYRSRSAGHTRHHSSFTRNTMANIDVALGLPFGEAQPRAKQPILTNPLDSWG
eukprot:TRINITY_DN7548_c0_g1_i2.p2 TRINITY_DN7548_c0_g1~~TRINITY_DN7548_c0_g1_i2.p2  ORF type:complete len:374 (+),score=66.08 TRINITY_DN7548_c0_g1_i2:1663-2784(+)